MMSQRKSNSRRRDTGLNPDNDNLVGRRAGQLPDELLPGVNSEAPQAGDEATGSPAGGLATSGIGGLPAGNGAPGMADAADQEDPAEPQSGRAGGAVGGTPVNKRSTPR